MSPTIPVLTPEQSNQWDERAVAAGIDRTTLMECAGRATTVILADRYAHLLRAGVLVAAGPGNNGGDGWVIARALHRADIPVWVTSVGSTSDLCMHMAQLARGEGVREVAPDGPWPTVGIAVDALLGTGSSGSPRAPLGTLIDRILDMEVPVLAVDGPTGVDLLTGVVHGGTRADVTVTFGGFRRGHLLARDEVGSVVVVDIGHPPAATEWPKFVTDHQAVEWQRRLRARDHKGDRGRVVIVGGFAGMTGALRMAARAAFAAGAGLVHAVAPPDTVAALVQAEPDVQTFAHPFDQAPTKALLELVERADAVAIGPGLGREAGRRELVAALAEAARAVLIDADGLVVFAGAVTQMASLGRARPLVLTPHPGEFRALFPDLASGRELDPWAAAAGAAKAAHATVLLKGVPTVIASVEGPLLTVAAGNPGLATGGSGDVLAGLIATALAQGLDPSAAAGLGSQALGRAADIAARRFTARSLRPMDVVNAIPDLWREWEILRTARPALRPPLLYELHRPQTT
ncbi:MAG TPA: NAD(P)H-hydrate dehydratase [Gemmatimonadales bacterium]|nr:NAD(P)H-hydrate dehydratase [Gemmatimonadales bacterium]